MRRERGTGGGLARAGAGGGRRGRHGVGVHMTSAMLERHSGISAAPTADPSPRDVGELSLGSAHVLCPAAPRCIAPCGTLHSVTSPLVQASMPSISIRFHGGLDSSPEKIRAADCPIIISMTINYCDLMHMY